MSKTILVEWPGLFSVWAIHFFSDSEQHILQNAVPSKICLHPAWAGSLLPMWRIIFTKFIGGFLQGHRMRAIMFTNFFGYFSPCFVSAFPRTHPRRSRWGCPVLRHTPLGELHQNSVAARWASSSKILGLGAFQTKNLVRFRKGLPIMQ